MRKVLVCAVLILAGVLLVFSNATSLLLSVVRYRLTPPVIVKSLIYMGADVNAEKDMFLGGKVLMHAVANNGNPEVIKLLLDAGANVNDSNVYKRQALMWAVRFTHNPEVIKLLLDAGADVNAKAIANWTPLLCATFFRSTVEERNIEVIKLLLNAGADVNAKGDYDGVTALMIIVANYPHPQTIKLLLSAGADISATDNSGNTALDYAESNEIKRLILDYAQ